MRRMIAAGPPAKRPPHNAFAGLSGPASGSWSALFGTALLVLFALLSAVGAQAADSVKLGEFIPARAPQPAPAVSFTTAAGRRATLGDFRGRPAVVNLWATWCAPCLSEMPSLDKLQQEFAGRLTVAAVAEDHGGAEVVNPFVTRQHFHALAIFLDPHERLAQALDVNFLPTSIVLDADGRIVGKIVGPTDWISAKMLAVLRPLLKNGAASPLIRAAR
jgi:thiol-disulfide isomerase/thioredoxin